MQMNGGINKQTDMCVSFVLHMYISIYIYIFVDICVYIYIYTHTLLDIGIYIYYQTHLRPGHTVSRAPSSFRASAVGAALGRQGLGLGLLGFKD